MQALPLWLGRPDNGLCRRRPSTRAGATQIITYTEAKAMKKARQVPFTCQRRESKAQIRFALYPHLMRPNQPTIRNRSTPRAIETIGLLRAKSRRAHLSTRECDVDGPG